MRCELSRRQALILSVAGVAVATIGTPAFANMTEDAIEAFAGGAEIQDGKIEVIAPEIAENGNSVPIEISVDSAMEGDDMVEEVLILADGNPNPAVATFKFTKLSGDPTASTRIRLAKSQNVVAVARMKDGSVYRASRPVKVTIGGCGG